ncbi:hypothetical protein DFH07DRAFT_970356 [Mycena maculata]|uniref:Transmembrane protein n=1 Tax=Mycena maculata TaxID=230809 RepID=A0AAD7HRY8_9AGAR|nr:hypothetical protein DFH07DRAFT_970356 [Mycena maculata]
MAALYLHNSIWVPDAADTPQELSPHMRTTSSATLQTMQTMHTDQSHPNEPLLHSSTSESVAYLYMLSQQPTHPNYPRGSPPGLNFDGDPTTVRERKGYADQLVRRRLRRLKVVMAILEVIMAGWSLYTTVRYFIAYAIYPSSTGQVVALVLATVSTVSFVVLFVAAVFPFLQLFLLGRNISIEILLTVRMALRYLSSFLLLAPAVVSFALVFAWRSSSDDALNMRNRCDVDVDVVWSIRTHSSCTAPPWGAWLALAIVRLLVTVAILTIYHLSLASYRGIRRPSRHRHHPSSTGSDSTFLGSPPMSGTPLPPTPGPGPGHLLQSSSSTLGSNSRPTPDRRSLRSSRGSSSMHRMSPSAGEQLRLHSPNSSNDGGLHDEFDPYADLPPLPAQSHSQSAPATPSETDRELYSFVDRFRSLVSQITRETEDGAYLSSDDGSSEASTSFLPPIAPAVGYDEFGRPYPPDEHVRILNAYVRRMPTIESIGSREAAGTASVTASSVYQEQLASLHTLSRPPTRAMTDRDEPRSRAGSLSIAAELISAMGVGADGMGMAELGELVDRVRRTGSIGSAGSYSVGGSLARTGSPSVGTAGTNTSEVSYFTASSSSGSPTHTPITEEPLEGIPAPPPPARRPLPRPPGLPRADSV